MEESVDPYAQVLVEIDDCGLRILFAMEFHAHGISSKWRASESTKARQVIIDSIRNKVHIA